MNSTLGSKINLTMENYRESWDQVAICGVPIADLKLEDGKAVLKVKMSADGNYSDAKTKTKKYWVDPKDLHDFIAGLTVTPQGIGNGVDCEMTIEIQTNSGFVPLPFDDQNLYDNFHDPYLFWTNDGGYDDPELDRIQLVVEDEKTSANKKTYDLLATGKYVLALVIDFYTTLFKRKLPYSFICGLEAFQELSRSCETSLARLDDKTIQRLQ